MAGVSGGVFSAPAPIEDAHDTAGFRCGTDALDDWLRRTALRSEGLSARTYVVCEGLVVVGYYCLATGSVARSHAPGRLRRNAPDPLPVMVLGRLAVDERRKGQGIGGGLLRDALRRSLQVSATAGCRAILVHAIDDAAAAFYARYGFVASPASSLTLFLSLETARLAL